MKYIRKLPEPEAVLKEYPLSEELKKKRVLFINDIKDILSGKSNRKLLLVGPCSADNEEAVIDYVKRLKKIQEEVKDKIMIVPRVYTSKPRTTGEGYKGIFHNQDIFSSKENILEGIKTIRKLHLKVIEETGFYAADEMLYPDVAAYISDLLGYVTIGARSVENQQHRLVASGFEMPVGIKNPTSGDISIMLNAIGAAQHPHEIFFGGYEVQTEGNKYSHAILRGYTNQDGVATPNYHYESLINIYDKYVVKDYRNTAIIVDCNHSNSNKQFIEQIRIAKEVFSNCKKYPSINKFVKGLMIESYIEDGFQKIGNNIYGKSITDPCLGWDKTKSLIKELYEIL